MRMYVLPVLITASAALAQSSVIIDVADPVLLPGQSTMVTLWAAFPTGDYALAAVITDLLSSVGGMELDGWSGAGLLSPLDGPGTVAGSPSGEGFIGIVAGQPSFPIPGILPDPTNPIAFWRATYTAPQIITDPFLVELSTRTNRFDVYVDREDPLAQSRLSTLTEGQATIHIIPAPAGAVVLGLGVLVAGRRRR